MEIVEWGLRGLDVQDLPEDLRQPLDDLLRNTLFDDLDRYHQIRSEIERRVRASQRHRRRSRPD